MFSKELENLLVITITVSRTIPLVVVATMLVCLIILLVLQVLDLPTGPQAMLGKISELDKEVMRTRALNTLGVHLGKES